MGEKLMDQYENHVKLWNEEDPYTEYRAEVEYYVPSSIGCSCLGQSKFYGLLLATFLRRGVCHAKIKRIERSGNGYRPSKTILCKDKVDIVPSDCVTLLLPVSGNKAAKCNASETHTDGEATHSSSSRINANEWTSTSTSLQFGDVKYYVTNIDEINVGNQVIWLIENPSLLIGKVTWIGESIVEGIQSDVVAVVEFDQLTENLPRYLQGSSNNRNIVSINELKIWTPRSSAPAKATNNSYPSANTNAVDGDALEELPDEVTSDSFSSESSTLTENQ